MYSAKLGGSSLYISRANRPLINRRDEMSSGQSRGLSPSNSLSQPNDGRPDLVPSHTAETSWVEVEYLMITHVSDAASFWAQVMTNEKADDLMKIIKLLASVCVSLRPIQGVPFTDKVYATVFSEDKQWYRCRVITTLNIGQSKVRYIDYGNEEFINNSAMVELPDQLAKLPSHANDYSLYGCQLNPISSQKQGIDEFKRLVEGHLLEGRLFVCDADGRTPAILMLEEEGQHSTVNGSMLSSGFVIRSGLLPTQQALRSPDHRVPSSPRSPGLLPTLGNSVSAREVPNNFGAVGDMQGTASVQEVPTSIPISVQDMQKKIESQQFDLSRQHTMYRVVQGELNNLKLNLGEGHLTHKMKCILSGASKVKHLRRLFPTDDDDTRDHIKYATDLVTDDVNKFCLEELKEVKNVEISLKAYNNSQDRLKAPQSQDDLANEIRMKDQYRQELYDNIVKFLAIVNTLPLDQRAYDLKDTERFLSGYYQAYLEVASKELQTILTKQLLQEYNQWMEMKMSTFSNIRTMTNTCHNALNSALCLVQTQISLDIHVVEENTSKSVNIDLLLTRFQKALDEEIKLTDMEKHPEDCKMVAKMLQVLYQAIMEEIKGLNTLQEKMEQFEHLKNYLEPWLVKKPDLTELQQIRKKIRLFKSKLRHKLAEQVDLEENDEFNPEELCETLKELTSIRQELQVLLVYEGQLMSDLSDLYINHFPEMDKQNPEIGIKNEQKYSGLLKSSRNLDLYTTEPLTLKKTVQRSVFNNAPIVLKECVVDCPKEMFMSNLFKLYKTINNNIVPIQGVFFSKNDRHAYIQMPYYENCLTSLMEHSLGNLNGKMIYKVLYGVLKGLLPLHSQRMVHGNIHPNNVLIDKMGFGVVADYDCTKTEKQRASTKQLTMNGLLCTAPEMSDGMQEPNTAADIYSFGIIMLMLHCPLVDFRIGPPIPDLSCLDLKPEVHEVLKDILHVSPTNRPDVYSLLKFQCFSSQPADDQPDLVSYIMGSEVMATNLTESDGASSDHRMVEQLQLQKSPNKTSNASASGSTGILKVTRKNSPVRACITNVHGSSVDKADIEEGSKTSDNDAQEVSENKELNGHILDTLETAESSSTHQMTKAEFEFTELIEGNLMDREINEEDIEGDVSDMKKLVEEMCHPMSHSPSPPPPSDPF